MGHNFKVFTLVGFLIEIPLFKHLANMRTYCWLHRASAVFNGMRRLESKWESGTVTLCILSLSARSRVVSSLNPGGFTPPPHQ